MPPKRNQRRGNQVDAGGGGDERRGGGGGGGGGGGRRRGAAADDEDGGDGGGDGKKRNRTTEEIYFRMLHDSRFDTENMIIGYHDRIRGRMEMKFSAFTPLRDGGDVPFHRLRYFRHPTGGVYYDRETKVDCITGKGGGASSGVPPDADMLAKIAESKANLEIIEFNAAQRILRKKQRWQGHGNGPTSGGGGGGGRFEAPNSSSSTNASLSLNSS
eukprot:CAMPEP_0182535822 /NCGR_PEP_ID=MMETSP1323-20130603/18763_1 /TAXON_ID=236787 /ORGANISM="Florenciella parvula, Strain RCC1693" /LENGTH=214 /DNA_ID=CAMNT_0024745999 /DNA_START=118 /DNA_END=758 /DNA_ORIENTATION=-